MAKVLVIEDLLDWRRRIRKWLEREGHEVVEAKTEEEARAILESDKAQNRAFALVVLDLKLREWSGTLEGMELLELTDRRYEEDCTRVIIVTAHGKVAQSREAFRKYEVLDFIPKASPDVDFYDAFHQAVREAIREYDEAILERRQE